MRSIRTIATPRGQPGRKRFGPGGPLVSEFRVYHASERRLTAGRRCARFLCSDNNGQIDGWVGMNIDISELRAADDALRDADKRKDEFLAVLGHELRNPLAPLSTGIQLLRAAADKPEIVETVQTMMERQLAASRAPRRRSARSFAHQPRPRGAAARTAGPAGGDRECDRGGRDRFLPRIATSSALKLPEDADPRRWGLSIASRK